MGHPVVDAEWPSATLPSGAANEAAARDQLLTVSGRPDHPPKRLRACPAALLGSHRADRSRQAPSVGQEGSRAPPPHRPASRAHGCPHPAQARRAGAALGHLRLFSPDLRRQPAPPDPWAGSNDNLRAWQGFWCSLMTNDLKSVSQVREGLDPSLIWAVCGRSWEIEFHSRACA